jgi:intein/homing endonuclease
MKSIETWPDSLNHKYGNAWRKVNYRGALGAFQFMPSTLRYLGFKGTFEYFLHHKEIQVLYMLRLIEINKRIAKIKSKKYNVSIEDFIGHTIDGVYISWSAIIGASHLAGVGNVQRWLARKGNASDGHATVKCYLKKFQNYDMNVNVNSPNAYKLLHEGILALSRAEQQGIRVDVDFVKSKQKHLTRKINRLEELFMATNFFKHWEHAMKGKVNIYSPIQLSTFLYKVKKLEPIKFTKNSTDENPMGATDDEALTQLNIPELNMLLECKKLKRLRDNNLGGFLREQVNGYIHPFFNLNLAITFRSCVSKGSLVLVVRDFIDHPNGIPIENVKKGDYVYCFDDQLNPSIQKVLWAGKTGHKEVIRIHYSVNGGGGKGFLDVTPEHKIRLIDGSYVQAKNLIGDLRDDNENIHLPKIRSLNCPATCKRISDTLRFTGHLRYGSGILEHRFIYSQLVGELKDEEIIHHRNGNHFDHSPKNLRKMTLKKHSSLHGSNVSDEIKQNRIQTLADNRHKIVYKKGMENVNSLGLSKFKCLLELARVSGKIVKTKHDFGVFKKYLDLYFINAWDIRLRYDKNGKYIWKKDLLQLSELGRAEVSKKIGHNYYKLIKLYKQYGLDIKRKWGNQFSPFKPGNHNITKIEWINKIVDVYDIEVENYHNFFANEICVHNSSDSPNFQNIPIRDEESMQACRRALFPRPGHQILEADFKGIEVGISACYNKDPQLIKYVSDPSTDMHRDMAMQIFFINEFNKADKSHDKLRKAAKNGFVFPEFYGSWYKNCAGNLACTWGKLDKGKWSKGQGITFEDNFLSNHLITNKIQSFDRFTDHLKVIENDFWTNRFPVYAEWKDIWFAKYQKRGFVDLYTGFRCGGVMSKNDATNYPIQGSAFHCLLWSFIQMDKWLIANKMDTKLIGQIHDSMILDVHPDERTAVVEKIKQITCKDLSNHWAWIIVPLNVDLDIAPVDGSWAEKEPYKLIA